MRANRNENLFICVILLTFCSTALVACSKTVPATSEQRSSALANEIRDVEASSNKSVKSVEAPRGKPGAQISLATNEIYPLKAGVVGDMKLVLLTPYTEGQLSVTVSASEGLALVSDVTDFNFLLEADTDYVIPLKLLAQEDGRYYVHLQVNLESEGRRTFRALSAIVQVGQEDTVTKEKLKIHKAGEATSVILLPAEETIINN